MKLTVSTRRLLILPLLAGAPLACFQDSASSGGSTTTTGGTTGGSGTSSTGDATTDGSGSSTGTTAGSGSGTTGGPLCGDGVVDVGEDCDDGNMDRTDMCDNDCTEIPLLLRYTFEDDVTNSGSQVGYDGVAGAGLSYIPGKFGMAAACSGNEVALTIPNMRALMVAFPKLTVGLWVREPMYAVNVQLFQSMADTGGFRTYHGSNAGMMQWATCAKGTNAFDQCRFYNYEQDGAWHHFAWSYGGAGVQDGEGARLRLYIDNELVTTVENPDSAAIVNPDMLQDILLCAPFGNSGMPNFELDDLKLFGTTFDQQGLCEVVAGGTWSDGTCAL